MTTRGCVLVHMPVAQPVITVPNFLHTPLRVVRVAGWVVVATLLAGAAAGQDNSVATRTTTHVPVADAKPSMTALGLGVGDDINLDGRLDEPIWSRAVLATDFWQKDPVEGAAPTESTTVAVIYTSRDLYIGAMLYDSDPSGIRAYQKQRDAGLGTDDRFMFILDTFLDGRTGYFFETNPAGLMGDGLISGGGGGGGRGGRGGSFGVQKSWNGIWEARVTRGDYGWSVEIRIPFSTLNFDPRRDTWGINFQRTVRRKNEEIVWSGFRRNQQFTRPIHAGRIDGLDGMSQGLGLEIKPYAVAGWTNLPTTDIGTDPTAYAGDAGFDLSYNITSSLRASVTVNTDFAQVEVDDRRVNLTRFPLFFPERRDFFLEGSGVFSFAPRNGVTPYFSRNIGLAAGEPVPITVGGRLGGQIGRTEVGLLHVQTRSGDRFDSDGLAFTVPAEQFTAARVKQTFFQQSTIGAIYTRRAASYSGVGERLPDNHTLGVDLDLFTSRFLGNKNLQFEAFAVWNSDPVPGGASTNADRLARGVRLNYPNDLIRASASYRELPNDFDPALGFTRRNGFRRFQPTVGFRPRPRNFLNIRQFDLQLQFEYLTDMDNVLETRKTDLRFLGVRTNAGDWLSAQVTQLFERLDGDFEISDGVVIPPGDYNALDLQVNFRSAGQRPVSANLQVRRGEFWSGTRSGLQLGATVKPVPGVQFTGAYEVNDVDLAQGSFVTSLIRGVAQWDISPWASVTSNVQYDDVSEVVGLYGRLRWILRPGSDLFFVYTHNWQNLQDLTLGRTGLSTVSQGATTKINFTQRF